MARVIPWRCARHAAVTRAKVSAAPRLKVRAHPRPKPAGGPAPTMRSPRARTRPSGVPKLGQMVELDSSKRARRMCRKNVC